jgi:hypothetical protein
MKKSELDKLLATRKSRFSVGDDRAPSGELSIHKSQFVGSDGMAIKVRKFQEDSDNLLLVSKATGIPIEKLGAYKRFQQFLEESELKKAMSTSTQSNWVPTDFSRDFIDKVQLVMKVAPMFPEIAMPRGSFQISRKDSFQTAYKKTEGSDATATPDITDGKVTLTAVTIADYVAISDELDEDAAFAQAPMIRNDAINAIARAIENAIINGDTTSTHMDADVTLSYDVRKCWKGLRRLARDNSYTTDLGTFNSVTVMGLKAKMGIYGADMAQLFWIIGPAAHVKLLNLVDAQSNANRIFLEMGSPGAPMASMLPGQVGMLAGSQVILSEFARETLNASGVYDGTTTDNGTLMLVRKDGFVRGVVRQVRVETDRDIVAGLTKLVVSTRMDFQSRYDISTEKTVWMGYNVDVA